MNESFALDDRRLRTAMEVLEREQKAFLPSRKELFRFRLFNWAIALFVLLFYLLIVDALLGLGLRLAEQTIYLAGFGSLLFAIIILFLLNIPLIGKLWRQARLRRRLGLKRRLKPLFKRERHGLRRAFNLIVSLALGLLAVVAILLFVAFVYDMLSKAEMRIRFEPLAAVIISLLLFLIPLSLISLVLMRRAKERLEIVTRLQRTLSSSPAGSASESRGPELSSGTVQVIAEIEREQIIQDRRRSLRLGSKKGQAPEYTIQQSRAVQQAKAQLDSDTARKVEDAIFALMGDPRPAAVGEDSKSGLSRLKVPETPIELAYQVEDETRRIKIFDLTSTDEQEAGAGGYA